MNQQVISGKRPVLITVILGLGGFVFAPFGINIPLADITINLPWSMVLPVMASLAYGWQFGLLAGLCGGALFPFLLWINNGWASASTTILYLGYYVAVGLLLPNHRQQFAAKKRLATVVISVVGLSIVIAYYLEIFNFVLAFNPPFWTHDTISNLPATVLSGFAFKDSANMLITLVMAETFLTLTTVRRLLFLPAPEDGFRNDKIFAITLSGAILMWAVYTGLDYFLFHNSLDISNTHNTLALLVILTSGFIIARLLIHFQAKQHRMQKKIDRSDLTHQKMITNIGDVLVIFDSQGVITYKSTNIERWFG